MHIHTHIYIYIYLCIYTYMYLLVGDLEHVCFHISGIIISIDQYFSEWYVHHQPNEQYNSPSFKPSSTTMIHYKTTAKPL